MSYYRSQCCRSVTKSCPTFWDPHGLQHTRLPCPSLSPRVCSNSCPLSQWCIQPSHPLLSPCPPALNLSQHQGLFQWVGSSQQVAKVLELQLMCVSYYGSQCKGPRIPRDSFLTLPRVYGLNWNVNLGHSRSTSSLAWSYPFVTCSHFQLPGQGR